MRKVIRRIGALLVNISSDFVRIPIKLKGSHIVFDVRQRRFHRFFVRDRVD